MKNRFEVILYRRPNPYAEVTAQVCKSFKNYASAKKLAEKLNARHCQETKYTCNRGRRTFVDINKAGIGCIEELAPVIVPSVGELGFW